MLKYAHAAVSYQPCCFGDRQFRAKELVAATQIRFSGSLQCFVAVHGRVRGSTGGTLRFVHWFWIPPCDARLDKVVDVGIIHFKGTTCRWVFAVFVGAKLVLQVINATLHGRVVAALFRALQELYNLSYTSAYASLKPKKYKFVC